MIKHSSYHLGMWQQRQRDPPGNIKNKTWTGRDLTLDSQITMLSLIYNTLLMGWMCATNPAISHGSSIWGAEVLIFLVEIAQTISNTSGFMMFVVFWYVLVFFALEIEWTLKIGWWEKSSSGAWARDPCSGAIRWGQDWKSFLVDWTIWDIFWDIFGFLLGMLPTSIWEIPCFGNMTWHQTMCNVYIPQGVDLSPETPWDNYVHHMSH